MVTLFLDGLSSVRADVKEKRINKKNPFTVPLRIFVYLLIRFLYPTRLGKDPFLPKTEFNIQTSQSAFSTKNIPTLRKI